MMHVQYGAPKDAARRCRMRKFFVRVELTGQMPASNGIPQGGNGAYSRLCLYASRNYDSYNVPGKHVAHEVYPPHEQSVMLWLWALFKGAVAISK